MGNSSSRTTSEMGISAKVNQSNSVSQDMECSALNINSISQNMRNNACPGGASQVMTNINADNQSECNIEGNMIAMNNQAASQDLQQTLTQASEAVTKGFNLGNSSEAIAESNTNISAEVNQSNTVSQKCYSSTLNVNRLQQNMYNTVATDGPCNQLIDNISLSNKAKAIGQCGLESSNVQKSDQTIKQIVEQTASATTEGIDFMALGFLVLCIAVLVFVVFSSVGAAGVGAVVAAAKGFLSIVFQIFGYVIGPLFIAYSIYTIITIYNEYNDLTTKHPWEIEDIDIPIAVRIMLIVKDLDFSVSNKYIEKIKTKVIKPGPLGGVSEQYKDGVFFINYSSVHYIDKTLTDQDSIRETLKSKGLQNPNLYRFSVNNKGIEDDKYNESDNPTPETAKTHMINNNYYAFEIIYYGVYNDGTIVKLDKPITLFYTKLDEHLWNYDLIGKKVCKDDSLDDTKIKSCGIETNINSPQCKGDNTLCDEGEFCGLGNTGCVNCKYCKQVTDGYGITKDTKDINPNDTCLKKCEDYTESRESLEAKINDCKICKGRVLQQSELFSEDNIIIGNNPWNKVEYSPELLNSEIYNNSEYQGNVKYENGKFKAYTDTSWNNIDLKQIGFSEYPTELQKDELTLETNNGDRNYIKFSGSSSLGASKCLMQSITYNDDDVPNIRKTYTELSPSPGGYENIADQSGICYDANQTKCVDKYSTMCVNFRNKKGSINECDQGSVMNLYKTLLHGSATDAEKRCADISLQSSISVEDWAQCKDICCVNPSSPPPPTSPSVYDDQVMCTYIPANSIKVSPRYIPFRSNIVGIRMYRDFSHMNQTTSPMNFVKDTAIIIFVVFAIILVICGILCYKIISSKGNNVDSEE